MKNTTTSKIDLLTRDFVLTDDQLQRVCASLSENFKRGLSKASRHSAVVKMFPTYVRDVPNGTESGRFLALDLGGTNFRVLVINLNGDKIEMMNKVYQIPDEVKTGTGETLFDHIALCLADFVTIHSLKDCKLSLGFTFSFPCEQESLTKAKLVAWTKGFSCSKTVGEDVVHMLQEAIQRRKDVEIDIVAVLNDTTGTLMSCAHQNRECRVGLIIGTGTNACYMEELSEVELVSEHRTDLENIIINCEWGAFGDDGALNFIRNDFDEIIDKQSLNVGKQLFEKMISGLYMGELARLIILEAASAGILFNGKTTTKLKTTNVIDASFVSLVDADKKGSFVKTKKALKRLDIENVSNTDLQAVRMICSRISSRAAFLVSAGVATILNRMKRPHTTVGVDGSVFRYHPTFRTMMNEKIRELTNSSFNFDLMLSEDGSGRGAALVAAVAARTAQDCEK